MQFFQSCRHPVGDAEADPQAQKFWQTIICSDAVFRHRWPSADCAVEKTAATPPLPRCHAEADHYDAGFGKATNFAGMQFFDRSSMRQVAQAVQFPQHDSAKMCTIVMRLHFARRASSQQGLWEFGRVEARGRQGADGEGDVEDRA